MFVAVLYYYVEVLPEFPFELFSVIDVPTIKLQARGIICGNRTNLISFLYFRSVESYSVTATVPLIPEKSKQSYSINRLIPLHSVF
jgi:hypothetical protein